MTACSDLDICMNIARNDSDNPIYQDAIRRIAEAELNLISTVKLIDGDKIQKIRKDQMDATLQTEVYLRKIQTIEQAYNRLHKENVRERYDQASAARKQAKRDKKSQQVDSEKLAESSNRYTLRSESDSSKQPVEPKSSMWECFQS